ncbi:MAG: hypothetical protein ACTTKZ_00905 [Bacteroides sp.]
MKLRYVLALAALATTVAFTSCKKDENKDNNKKKEEPKKELKIEKVADLAGDYKGKLDKDEVTVKVVAAGDNVKLTCDKLGLKDTEFKKGADITKYMLDADAQDGMKKGATADFAVKENADKKAEYTLTLKGKDKEDKDVNVTATMVK